MSGNPPSKPCPIVWGTALLVAAAIGMAEYFREAILSHGVAPWQLAAATIFFAGGLTALVTYLVACKGIRSARALREQQEKRQAAEKRCAELGKKTVEVARQVGMAQTTSDVLHNLKDAASSTRITTQEVYRCIDGIGVDWLDHAVDLLDNSEENLNPEKLAKLRTFLTKYRDFLKTRRDELSADTRRILKNLDFMTKILRAQQGTMRLSGAAEWLSIVELVEDAINLSLQGLNQDNVSIERHLDFDGEVEVSEHLILQVLINLIGNARSALRESFAKERCITISTRRHGDGIAIEVADNGIGIPEEILPHIFTHGFTTHDGGHGFGLHTCQRIAEELNGAISVHSDGAGKGAAFALELPNVPVGSPSEAAGVQDAT